MKFNRNFSISIDFELINMKSKLFIQLRKIKEININKNIKINKILINVSYFQLSFIWTVNKNMN